MRLFAAILPPDEAMDEVRRVVRSVNDPLPASSGGRGLLRRFSGRGAAASPEAGRTTVTQPPEPETEPTTHELDVPAPEHMYLPITGFGNVTMGDSVRLANTLRRECAAWRSPELVFAGAAALEFPGDVSVWVKLDGDVEDLKTIGRGVPHAVQRDGFFVDRRQFRPWLSVGTITDTTTAPYLERLVAALDAFRGEPWTADAVHLMKWLPDVEHETFEVMERMPLASG